MGQNSKIEWCDHTFNPWMGCTRVSEGCVNCYAEAMMDRRYGKVQWGPQGTRARTSAQLWKQPLKWNKQTLYECTCGWRGPVPDGQGAVCPVCGTTEELWQSRQRVFCGSLMDVADHHPSVLNEWIEDLVRLIAQTPNLDWLLLTKRPEELKARFTMFWGTSHWPENVWVGVSVENQKAANTRIPILQTIPAAVKFLSCEPLLDYVDLSLAVEPDVNAWDEVHAMDDDGEPEEFIEECEAELDWINYGNDLVLNPAHREWEERRRIAAGYKALAHGAINWVICGGESGPNARPMDPGWARALRDICDDTGVHFFFKQWGEYIPLDHLGLEDETEYCPVVQMGQSWMVRAGKKKSGNMLDGKTWREVPSGSNY